MSSGAHKKQRERLGKAADRLINSKKTPEAIRIIEKFLRKNSEDKEAYEIASFIYWSNSLYTQAKAVHHRFFSRFGMALKSDVSLQELEDEEKNYRKLIESSKKGNGWIFKARFFWIKRLLNFPAVKELRVAADGITMIFPKQTNHYSWNEVLGIRVVRADGGGEPGINHLFIITKEMHYRLSDAYFERGWILIENALPAFIRVKHSKVPFYRWKQTMGLIIALLIIFVAKFFGDGILFWTLMLIVGVFLILNTFYESKRIEKLGLK